MHLLTKILPTMLAMSALTAQANPDMPPPLPPTIIPGIPGVPGMPGSDPIAPHNPPPASPPYFYSVSPTIANVGDLVMIRLSASDPDSPSLTYSFRPHADLSGAYISGDTFYWRATEPGTYFVTFFVSDGLWTDDETTTITVRDF